MINSPAASSAWSTLLQPDTGSNLSTPPSTCLGEVTPVLASTLALDARSAVGTSPHLRIWASGGYCRRHNFYIPLCVAGHDREPNYEYHSIRDRTNVSAGTKLSALGLLAAAATHKLGTPFATITVNVKKITRELPPGPLADDAELILSQAQRCRSILEQLALRGDTPDLIYETLSLKDLPEEAAGGFIDRDRDLIVESFHSDDMLPLTIREDRSFSMC